jgi:hypothetical protein
MKITGFIAVLALNLFVTRELQAQAAAEKQVEAVILELFDGMRAADSSRVSILFHPTARMMTSYPDSTGQSQFKEGSLEGFLRAVGTPHPEVWDEKIWNTEVRIDDNLAQVWTDYAFYIGDRFSHCGVDAFHLIRGRDGRWRIVNLVDTRRKQPCSKS